MTAGAGTECRPVTQLTCRHDHPLLLRGAAGRRGRLGAEAGLRVRRLERQGGAVAAHVSGALGHAAVHRGLAAGRERKDSCQEVTVAFLSMEYDVKLMNKNY